MAGELAGAPNGADAVLNQDIETVVTHVSGGRIPEDERMLVSHMRIRALALLMLVLLPATAFAQAPAAATPQTDEEKTLYAVGLLMARSLRQFDLSAPEIEVIRRAIG